VLGSLVLSVNHNFGTQVIGDKTGIVEEHKQRQATDEKSSPQACMPATDTRSGGGSGRSSSCSTTTTTTSSSSSSS
jgi:hypothetical protein